MIAPNHQVMTGLDVLEAANFAALRQARRLDHQSDRHSTATGQRNIDVMRAAGVNVTALFSPRARNHRAKKTVPMSPMRRTPPPDCRSGACTTTDATA